MGEPSTAGDPAAERPGFLSKPSTRLGWWSVGLAATFAVLMLINGAVFMQLSESADGFRQTVLPFFGIAMMAIGLAAGVTGAVAIIRQRERSWFVWLPILTGLFVALFVAGEFLFPH